MSAVPGTAPAVGLARGTRPPAPNPLVPNVLLAVAGGGLGAVVALTIADQPFSALSAHGGVATFVGSLTGMVGAYLALVMLVLVSRLAPLERSVGQDQVLRWHQKLAPWPLSLLTIHAVTVTLGYAEATKTGFLGEIGQLLSGYRGVLSATVALGLMLLAGIFSIRAIRTRLKRETWWVLHLYMYIALALSIAHVIALGPSFVNHPLTQTLWVLIWVATAGVVLAYRVLLPLYRSVRYDLRVEEVRREAPGIVSVICAGRDLHRLPVAGGQFCFWRFLTPQMWWQAHPYSLSALPQEGRLRLTVKAVGDHSAAVAKLAPGTRIVFEGPYGAFRAEARERAKVVLLAAGIGVTSIRSLLEDLPRKSRPVVILRAGQRRDLALLDEIEELAAQRGGKVITLIGTREKNRLDPAALWSLVPDIQSREAYVCGPTEFVDTVTVALRGVELPEQAIHHEAYALW
ncbi:ferric reductase-like transmembrane domain-containing protein [Conexibacter sp. DBS9H8]|uniref:ferredoxin reductase family protein n=1 Tax=Conexibacter sp. DBS9H8 TaxID=2937801 RepID=UPI00200D8681|nr:ferredoxin reductase family protein [Conexibacter sp. DBS9H8]